MLTAPLIHDPDFERFPSRSIYARCYEYDHAAPAPGCRCGLYASVDGTLDSLAGYLSDSSHDLDPPIFAEIACSGRVFVDRRGVRAEQITVLRLATSAVYWPDAAVQARAIEDLATRYGVAIVDVDAVPDWVLNNVMPQGAPADNAHRDLDSIARRLTRERP